MLIDILVGIIVVLGVVAVNIATALVAFVLYRAWVLHHFKDGVEDAKHPCLSVYYAHMEGDGGYIDQCVYINTKLGAVSRLSTYFHEYRHWRQERDGVHYCPPEKYKTVRKHGHEAYRLQHCEVDARRFEYITMMKLLRSDWRYWGVMLWYHQKFRPW
jgi:hypothetical protein